MAFYACVVTRLPREGAGTRVAVYVIAVIMIIAVWLTGHSLPDAIAAAAGAGWAASMSARKLREIW